MKCWNCLKEIPEGAGSCGFCEARQADDPLRDMKDIQKRLETEDLSPAQRAELEGQLAEFQTMFTDLVDKLPPEAMAEMTELMGKFGTAEEFTAAIFIGDCPGCGSSETQDCETVKGIEDPTVGRCKKCAALFCSECHTIFADGKPTEATKKCPHCGSTNTTFNDNPDEEEEMDFDPAFHCLECEGVYCAFCGAALEEDEAELDDPLED